MRSNEIEVGQEYLHATWFSSDRTRSPGDPKHVLVLETRVERRERRETTRSGVRVRNVDTGEEWVAASRNIRELWQPYADRRERARADRRAQTVIARRARTYRAELVLKLEEILYACAAEPVAVPLLMRAEVDPEELAVQAAEDGLFAIYDPDAPSWRVEYSIVTPGEDVMLYWYRGGDTVGLPVEPLKALLDAAEVYL